MSERATTDFFQRQDDARRKTGRLILLFAVAILLLSTGTYIALGFLLNPEVFGFVVEADQGFYVDIELALLALMCTGAFIFIGSAYKTSGLKEGGASVAESLGGVEIDSSVQDPLRRRLVNVVEEMSLASGVPVPRIYVLEDEMGINAFAAGYTINDAAVAVTRGALEQLTRDELQGVIAHEYSHILNGDMRLNIRLIGVIHGILLIYLTGRIMLRAMGGGRRSSGSRGRGAGAALLGGFVLMVFGLGGVMCGRLIKSAVSRQREYLADAAAVQFTRNPEGLAGALKKIGGYSHGSKIEASKAEEVSHMCFEKVSSRGTFSRLTGQMMATHPPLEKRIKAIDPSFDGGFQSLDAETKRAGLETDGSGQAMGLAGGSGGGATAAQGGEHATGGNEWSSEGRELDYDMEADDVVDAIGEASPEHLVYCATLLDEIPKPLAEARRNLMGAMAICYTLLLDEDAEERQKQGRMLSRYADRGVVEECRNLWPTVATLDREFRLPLMDLVFPVLRRMSEQQFQKFAAMINRLIQADGKVTFKEFVLEKVLLHRLEMALHDPDRDVAQYHSFSGRANDFALVLSCLAAVGHEELSVAKNSFAKGVAQLPDAIHSQVKFKSPEQWKFEEVGSALERLSVSSPAIERAIIEACAHCVMGDDKVVVDEAEMLRAICEVLDAPLPPFIPVATRRDKEAA